MPRRRRSTKDEGCLVSLITLPLSLIAMMFTLVLLPVKALLEILAYFLKKGSGGFRTVSLCSEIDKMDGHDFEYWCANLLRQNGFTQVEVTRGSGDQGVDIIAWKDGQKYAIQCKRYSQKLGNKPIQEVHTGKTLYNCQVGVVMTNNYFTPGAEQAAKAVGVQLWDRDILKRMVDVL